MARDLLEQLRGKGTGEKILAGPARVQYEAFKVSDRRQIRLKVRPALRAWERMSYGYLQHITEDGIYGTQLGIVYTFSVVVIKGRNLKPIIDAIDAETCEFVQAFDPHRWDMPSDPKAPFIESITVHVQTRVEAMDQARAEIKATVERSPATQPA